MTRQELYQNIKKKKSFLCIGLDTDLKKIPRHLHSFSDPIFEFNKQIIDTTHDLCVAYKPNTAFYESIGSAGWESLEKTADYLKKFKNIFTIADAKRGDIGNTSSMYAQAFFGSMDFDAITVAPYMGEDSVTPFLQYEGKWVILLALTSNKGASDFQTTPLSLRRGVGGEAKEAKLFEQVLTTSQNWGSTDNMMYVVGATRAEMLADVRKIVPDHFLLVPGIGAQGGNLQEVVKYGMNKECGLIVNSSRNIIYASDKQDFAAKAREEAMKMQKEMEKLLEAR
ncbi:MAG: orotidine-5'-phosphate decarboxylase [Bacteroidetes bacterium]|nr:MAG: orotidine-5'-phosphate decarboxylase [Bacteroidota bacterium]